MNMKKVKKLVFILLLILFVFDLKAQVEKLFTVKLNIKADSITYIEPIIYNISIVKLFSEKRGESCINMNAENLWLELFSKKKKSWEKMNMMNMKSQLDRHLNHRYGCNSNQSKQIDLEFSKIAFNEGIYYLKNEKNILLRAAFKTEDSIYYSNSQSLKVFFDEKERDAIQYLMQLSIYPSITTNPINREFLGPFEKFKIATEFIKKHPKSFYSNYARKSLIIASISKASSIGIEVSKEERIQLLNQTEEHAFDLLSVGNEEFFEFAKYHLEMILEQKLKLQPQEFYYLIEIEKLHDKIDNIQKKRH